jgi:serine/threonine-protein kinase
MLDLPRSSGLSLLGAGLSIGLVFCALWAPDLTLLIAGVNVMVVLLALWSGPRSESDRSRASDQLVSDQYEIVSKISEGGMGEVFRAKQVELGRLVALKRIKAERLTADDRARFKREARVLSSLFNPHTINVFDAGIQNDKTLFYVMELLDGIDLRVLVEKEGPLEPARVVHILRQATMSLLEAHQKDLVHRDLKPANIMVCRYGVEFYFVKVLDFGLVKGGQIDDGDSFDVITRACELPGTPAFLAPESVSGRAHLDSRADFYSLGAVGYFLLTGAYLFDAETPLAMVRAQLHDEPPRA